MILHFIWIGEHFYYPFYLGVVSANKIVKKDKTLMWTIDPPINNPYWNLLSDIVEIRNIETPKLPNRDLYLKGERGIIFSNYLRFDKLYEHGGIYMDTDTLTLKDFNYLLGDYEAVISKHSDSAREWIIQNAIMMSKPESELMRIARDTCISILKKSWVRTKYMVFRNYKGASSGPGAISHAYRYCDKSKVRVCNPDMFFPFGFRNVKVFDSKFQHSYDNLHVLHYYSATNKDKFKHITPDWIEKSNTVYAKLVKSVLSEEEWRV